MREEWWEQSVTDQQKTETAFKEWELDNLCISGDWHFRSAGHLAQLN